MGGGGLPWDQGPQQPRVQPPLPQAPYQEPGGYTYQSAPPQQGPGYSHRPAPTPPAEYSYRPAAPRVPGDMHYDEPRPGPPRRAPRPQVDLGAEIMEAVNAALVQNRQHVEARGQQAVNRLAGRKPAPKPAVNTRVSESGVYTGGDSEDPNAVEDAFSSGPMTMRVFIQGMSVDLGFAMMATLATVMRPGFDLLDKEAWIVTGVLVVKTLITTAISYVLKFKVT